MSKLIRIDEDCEAILRSYSDGSMSDCIRSMAAKIDSLNKPQKMEASIDLTPLMRRFDKMEEGVRNVNTEFMQFISSGQGAVRIYEKVEKPTNDRFVYGVNKVDFKTAAQLKEEK